MNQRFIFIWVLETNNIADLFEDMPIIAKDQYNCKDMQPVIIMNSSSDISSSIFPFTYVNRSNS